MRIIGGSLGGLRIPVPAGLPVRPTTDLAKEALFNILQNRMDLEGIRVLDLFSGTGSMSLEFASRGAAAVTGVDIHFKCFSFLKEQAQKHKLEQVKAVKADVLKYLKTAAGNYDLIFADPPYDLRQLARLPAMIAERQLLAPGGLLILEHPSTLKLNGLPGFAEQRKYGYSSFSIFE